MIRAMWTSASGMQTQQMNIDVISNNLANSSTPGYKKMALQFEDVMYQTEKSPGAKLSDGSSTPTGLQVGYGSRPTATSKSFQQGDMQNTGESLDVAIQGRGFFEVDLPDGTKAYTRDGSFKLNSDGELVTNLGYKVSGTSQIDTNATEIAIATDGTITIRVNGDLQSLSPITLANFPNPSGLRNMGNNLFVESDASGAVETGLTPGTNGIGGLAQGFLESSNVRVVEEMVRMIEAQRAYEINSKAIQTSDEMLSLATNLKR
ncbi:MAG: flagellar basal-body rod protein FlgG [Verrucomicrobiota bacterium]